MNNAEQIWEHLISAGLSPQGAAALMGNLQAESALNPKNLQNSFEARLGMDNESYTAAVDNGTYGNFVNDGAGYGLAQWTHSSRKSRLQLYARSVYPASIGDLTMQLKYLCYELQGYYPAIWAALKSTTDVHYASDLVLTQYERPADQGQAQADKRYSYSLEYYNQFEKKEETTMATATEKRAAVIAKYGEILGRNNYSQPKRDYCYKKYKDGKYYSDCSSSVSYAYKEAGYSFGILNTVGMYQSTKMKDVAVTIKNGIIQNPEVLRPGDMLLFAGTDSSRAYAGYVGHVEMVAKIDGTKVTIYGHGSGTPRKTEMNAYCKSRYGKKASTKLGHRGLIKVRRFIQDDAAGDTPSTGGRKVKVTGGTVNIRTGPGTQYDAVHVAKKGEKYNAPETDGWRPIEYDGRVCWISANYSELED